MCLQTPAISYHASRQGFFITDMKRFYETEEYNDPSFKKMQLKHKMLWLYMSSACDCAGFIFPDADLFSAMVKAPIDLSELQIDLRDRVLQAPDGSWALTTFIKTQYGNSLKESSSVHKGVIRRIAERGYKTTEEFLNKLPNKPSLIH